ncbi:hypothetical protein [Echinicola sp. 20G]|uniref:hypothetical protein n=1 Tax=Echinicola sp. 20G TaxID=2781961 RepID=UPI0019102F7D|nr:hypothetical protein [Echinicola sp. 20G]
MKNRFYVNSMAYSDGYHEVHHEKCQLLPNANQQLFLGYFENFNEAIGKSKRIYPLSMGCQFCCKKKHDSKQGIFEL